MQISTLYCTTKYYSEYDSTAVLIRLQEEFSIPIRDISHEMLMPLYKLYFTRHVVKIGRNDLCPCGSGKKYKHCCGQ